MCVCLFVPKCGADVPVAVVYAWFMQTKPQSLLSPAAGDVILDTVQHFTVRSSLRLLFVALFCVVVVV